MYEVNAKKSLPCSARRYNLISNTVDKKRKTEKQSILNYSYGRKKRVEIDMISRRLLPFSEDNSYSFIHSFINKLEILKEL